MNPITDKPWWKRSAFYHMVITLLTGIALIFPDWDVKIKAIIMLVQQVATFIGVDQMTYSVDPKALPTNTILMERDGTTPAPLSVQPNKT